MNLPAVHTFQLLAGPQIQRSHPAYSSGQTASEIWKQKMQITWSSDFNHVETSSLCEV